MPSRPLRRTLSSPPRSTPYTTTSTCANLSLRTAAPNAPTPRRASGSDTFGRRVLADLDWWTVHGYVPASTSTSFGDENAILTSAPNASPTETVSLASAWDVSSEFDSVGVDWAVRTESLTEFGVLSIAPSTPTRSSATLSPTSSPSSLRASPTRAPTPLELGLAFAEEQATFPAVPAYLLTPSRPSSALSTRRGRQGLLVRSASASYVEFNSPERKRRATMFEDFAPSPTRATAHASDAHPDLFF